MYYLSRILIIFIESLALVATAAYSGRVTELLSHLRSGGDERNGQ